MLPAPRRDETDAQHSLALLFIEKSTKCLQMLTKCLQNTYKRLTNDLHTTYKRLTNGLQMLTYAYKMLTNDLQMTYK